MTGFFLPTYLREGNKQGAFAESHVRCIYRQPRTRWIFHSKCVWVRKSLKAPIKLDTSELVFFVGLFLYRCGLGLCLLLLRGERYAN